MKGCTLLSQIATSWVIAGEMHLMLCAFGRIFLKMNIHVAKSGRPPQLEGQLKKILRRKVKISNNLLVSTRFDLQHRDLSLNTLNMGLPVEEWRADLAAARLALQHVNRRRLVPGYRLRLITNNTKCSPGVGVDAFFHALHTRQSSKMIALLGTGCSEVTEQLAQIVPYWNILQMSFGSFSPALSDRTSFPLFFRTSPPESAHNPARLAFVAYHKWDAVATLSQNSDEHTLAINDLVTELENNNITLLATATFDINDYQEQLQTLKDRDVRIIIGSFAPSIARRIFCEAYRLGMYGDDYAWLLYGGVAERWWRRPRLNFTGVSVRARRCSGSTTQFNFTGVSGPVSFNGADRRGLSAFYQLRGERVKSPVRSGSNPHLK
ncbi:gamma-aminobutyric acid type B receptor subunit 1-like [Pollicipes pollicipes]|uniref:gamma-aminobutyric acid type B receptor subunit 1-like n=1 Tax=Pollicipes pollicipes TaxID=41117 RepID=UPI0018858C03|nr:gamma-aminobutyric acid type B receptor subunit 1-like [Pollicipes pollicipes]